MNFEWDNVPICTIRSMSVAITGLTNVIGATEIDEGVREKAYKVRNLIAADLINEICRHTAKKRYTAVATASRKFEVEADSRDEAVKLARKKTEGTEFYVTNVNESENK